MGGRGERTILGGLKTKNVDVVVTRDGLGPVLAVSCKGVTAALRNLTNRMEETIGECTNLHITYPALVLGYLVVLRGNRDVEAVIDEAVLDASESRDEAGTPSERAPRSLGPNDIALSPAGRAVASIARFHNALAELTGRRGIRDDVSRYESIGVGLVDMTQPRRGALFPDFPPPDSALHLDRFFSTLYRRYDERFVTSAPDLAATTRRLVWAPDSPAMRLPELDYGARTGDAEPDVDAA